VSSTCISTAYRDRCGRVTPIAACSDTPKTRTAYHGSSAAGTAPDAGAVAIAPAAAAPVAPTVVVRLWVVVAEAVVTAFPGTRPRLAVAPSAPAARAPPPVVVVTRDCVQTM